MTESVEMFGDALIEALRVLAVGAVDGDKQLLKLINLLIEKHVELHKAHNKLVLQVQQLVDEKLGVN